MVKKVVQIDPSELSCESRYSLDLPLTQSLDGPSTVTCTIFVSVVCGLPAQ